MERNRARGGRLEKVSGALLVRRFSVRQPEMYRVVETVLARKLTPIDKAALCELAQTVMDIEYDGLAGDFIEISDAPGGAAIVITEAKRRNRPFIQIDPTFSGELTGSGPVAFAHVDCSEYGPMRIALEQLAPRLVSGGQLIIDDYKTREGCRKAVDEYFHGKGGFLLQRKSRLHVIKKGE